MRVFAAVLAASAVAACAAAAAASRRAQSSGSSTAPLPAVKVVPGSITAGGLSAGAFFAVQVHVAFSSFINGATVVAGGPYYCAQTGSLETATTTCMSPNLVFGPPNPSALVDQTWLAYFGGRVDGPGNLTGDPVYVFSGQDDSVVAPVVVNATRTYYDLFGAKTSAELTWPAEHCFPTDQTSYGEPCAWLSAPYIGQCGYNGAQVGLEALYGSLNPPVPMVAANLIEFDQTLYGGGANSLNSIGYVYVPTACQSNGTAAAKACRLHVNFHGCEQSTADIGTAYPTNTGLSQMAEANDIIVLYPQVEASQLIPFNPKGCFDWWGYSGSDYAWQSGPQMAFTRKLLDTLTGGNLV